MAEGVETTGQLQQLRKMGCALQQGYYFTSALPAAEFEIWRIGDPERFAAAAA